MTITTGQIEAWIAAWLWPFLRIGACLMVAPIFGTGAVPVRFRIVLVCRHHAHRGAAAAGNAGCFAHSRALAS